jgi:deoxyribodipyrimidine photo-lyase
MNGHNHRVSATTTKTAPNTASMDQQTQPIDVVWLKKDVRLHDHGPLHEVAMMTPMRPLILLYLFEPDQLQEKTIHGSHVLFAYEGLVDLERRLQQNQQQQQQQQQCITICHNTAVATLESIHQSGQYRIARLLAHQETGHWQSFMRDRAVRKWCKERSIPFKEFNQTGVTRCLKNRDDFSKNFHDCITAPPEYPIPDVQSLRQRLVHMSDLPGTILFRDHMEDNKKNHKLDLNIFSEIPIEHRCDRPQRQQVGGETKALATLDSFLQERGSKFSQGISSPNTSWNSCSRLSPYLTFGHVSLRHVIKALKQRQETLRCLKSQGRNIGTWLKSLQAFSSRLHFRSHFIQKLETEPQLQFTDLCPSFQHIRRQEGDWNDAHYQAWVNGTTGFPFVDACQRCLHEHGWINFRMRAMLVSFATYNLWLDWTKISSHLARVFLDYEPGIVSPLILCG